jgi:hypothetical protein
MIRDQLNHGFDPAAWEAAKQEARAIMIERARVRGMIPYSDLVARITSVRLAPHDPRLFHFLGEIASEDDEQGLGLTTVVVVHKNGDMQPGPGFFELAKSRGRDTSDILGCWVSELHKVHAVWSKR